MRRLIIGAAFTLLSLSIPEKAHASGWIVVDPIGPVPAASQVASPLVSTRTQIPANGRTPRPSTRTLNGYVSFGLHMQNEKIKVEIKDHVAKTRISQTFSNDYDVDVAGTYLFPLPEDTTFSSFSLTIDGKPVEGQILEARQARTEYEAIVRRMVDPGLLEYADSKTVRVRIFPIPKHGIKKVEFEYIQLLKPENGMLKYRFPLKGHESELASEIIDLDVKLACTQGLRTVWSPSHRIITKRSSDSSSTIKYLDENVTPDKDFILYFSMSNKELAPNLVTHKVGSEDGYFLFTLTPAADSKRVVPKDIVLVLDTSSSMLGEKIEDSKKALKFILSALNPDDRFDIVQFGTEAQAFRPALIAANANNKQAALKFVDDLEMSGGTNMSDALRMASTILDNAKADENIENRPVFMVLLTDGKPNIGETSLDGLTKCLTCKRDVRLADFGVGFDVETQLLNKLAEQHHGIAQFLHPGEDIEQAMSEFYQKIKNPVLTDVDIKYDGIEVCKTYPKEVKDIFGGSQILLLGRYKNGGRATINLTGKIEGESKNYNFPLTFDVSNVDNSYLPRLWAMRRIAYLTDIARENDNREVVDEIIQLSKKYGIISQYTSFLSKDPNERRSAVNTRFPTGTRIRGNADTAPGHPALSASMDVDHGPYMAAIQRQIKRAWFPPRGSETKNVAVRFKIHKNGEISDLLINRSSGSHLTDRAALNAIKNAAPFNQLPQGSHESVDVEFTFDYNTLGRTGAFDNLTAPSSGETAVRSARTINDMKRSVVIPDSGDAKLIDGKTFYRRNGFWVESTFDEGDKTLKMEKYAYATPAYFELARTKPQLLKYLALGKQLIFESGGIWYKIF